MSLDVKWILFDFGGCLDSDGLHSRTLFHNQFKALDLISNNAPRSFFEDAYTYADKKVIEKSLVVNSNLKDMNEIMCSLIAEKIIITDFSIVKDVASAITETQSFYLIRNGRILKELQNRYRLGVVSNFSGNLSRIFDEFSLTSYFDFVLDSYHIGVRKPNPQIFKMAVEHCGVNPAEILFIGDNIERDIRPAKTLGMNTILLSATLDNSEADYTLASLEELFALNILSKKKRSPNI